MPYRHKGSECGMKPANAGFLVCASFIAHGRMHCAILPWIQPPPFKDMTRINCVPVEELSGPHLVAEYRELPRIFRLAEKAVARGPITGQPQTYTLGTGHLRFFYTRLGYLVRRHTELVHEMKARGYKPAFSGVTREDFLSIPDQYWADWQPTPEALQLNRARILERTRAVESRRPSAEQTSPDMT